MDNFIDLEDKWNWNKVVLSEGNPYVVDGFVQKRNLDRSYKNERTR